MVARDSMQLDQKEVHLRIEVKRRDFILRLKWPSPQAFRKLWEEMIIPSKQEGEELHQPLASENPHFLPFLVAHAEEISVAGSVEGPLSQGEDLQRWLTENEEYGFAIAEASLNHLLSIDIADFEPTGKITSLDQLAEREPVRFSVRDYDVKEQTTAEYSFEANLIPPTAMDRQEWNDARFVATKRKQRYFQARPLPIQSIFKRRIIALKGAEFAGEPCTEENKENGWHDEVPFPWVYGILNHDAVKAQAQSFI